MAMTYSWSDITSSQTDANSPLNQTLFDAIRNDLYHLEEWLGGLHTADANHSHNGTNSALLAADSISNTQMANNAIHQAELYAVAAEASQTNGLSVVTITSEYSFFPLVKRNNAVAVYKVWDSDIVCGAYGGSYYDLGSSTYHRTLTIEASGAGNTVYMKYRYVGASPPHAFAGSDDWGPFLFVIRDANDGTIYGTHFCEDPPWELASEPHLSKGHPLRIQRHPLPWAGWEVYNDKAAPEVALIDLRALNEEATHREEEARLLLQLSNAADIKLALEIDDTTMNALTAMQEERVAAEEQQITQGEAEFGVAEQWRAGALEKLRGQQAALQAWRDEPGVKDFSKAPVISLSSDAIEQQYRDMVRKARHKARRVKKWERRAMLAEQRGESFAEEVHAGKIPEVANAQYELPENERALLPQAPAFANNVRVLQAK